MMLFVILMICVFMIWESIRIGRAYISRDMQATKIHVIIFLVQGVLLGLIYKLL